MPYKLSLLSPAIAMKHLNVENVYLVIAEKPKTGTSELGTPRPPFLPTMRHGPVPVTKEGVGKVVSGLPSQGQL